MSVKPPPEQSIGERIREKREELGLNFEQLAALTREYDYHEQKGVAAVTLRRYERAEGATLPGLRELRLLCDALDVRADYLLRNKTESADELLESKEQLDAIRAILASATTSHVLGQGYDHMERQEKLRRARLHTKGAKEQGRD